MQLHLWVWPLHLPIYIFLKHLAKDAHPVDARDKYLKHQKVIKFVHALGKRSHQTMNWYNFLQLYLKHSLHKTERLATGKYVVNEGRLWWQQVDKDGEVKDSTWGKWWTDREREKRQWRRRAMVSTKTSVTFRSFSLLPLCKWTLIQATQTLLCHGVWPCVCMSLKVMTRQMWLSRKIEHVRIYILFYVCLLVFWVFFFRFYISYCSEHKTVDLYLFTELFFLCSYCKARYRLFKE